MGRDAAKACENQCFRCRKEAAKYNDKLGSREGAAELLGISVSSLADYELGNTKVIPVDKVVLMADIYNAPELMAWYCSNSYGIRPALKAPSILFEDSEAGLDLSKIPTDDLLQEIHRRLAEKA